MLREAMIGFVRNTAVLANDRVFSVVSEQATDPNTPYAVVEVDRELVNYDAPSLRINQLRSVEWRVIIYAPEEETVDDILEDLTRMMATSYFTASPRISIQGAMRTDLAVSRIDSQHQSGWQGAAAFASPVRYYA